MVPQPLYEKLIVIFSAVVMAFCIGSAVADYFIPSQIPDYAVLNEKSDAAGVYLVNINTADEDALMELPGIGETYAARIVAFREEYGPYSCPEDLTNVQGIGDALVEKIRDLITY